MFSSVFCGIVTYLVSYSTELWQIGLSRFLQGAMLALTPTASISLIRETFP